ncbi:MAG: MFS transporter [Burkholderiaceae bacterium]
MTVFTRQKTVLVFLAFAFAYFLSALIRAITATLAPVLTQEFSLHARDLGLLSGGYFLGFSLTQLPLGSWLDRHGPRRVITCFLAIAVMGSLAFAAANSFSWLLVARVLCGVGVSACLMAPLTGYRRWFGSVAQMRANSWMLMTGSLGMVASTLPVQWLVPQFGWRPIFLALGLLLGVSVVLILRQVPAWADADGSGAAAGHASYREVWRHPYFRAMAPVGFFCYGGLLSIQTLWAAPWMVQVGNYSPLQAATGLFWINVTMLCTFWSWGMGSQWLARHGFSAERLIARGLPFSFIVLAVTIVSARFAPGWCGVLLALYCMACSVVTPAQPSIGMAFAPELAGRALSAYNLVVFAGVFVIQWGIGLMIDGLVAFGAAQVLAHQLAFAVYLGCGVLSYVYFLSASSHNHPAQTP